MDKLPKPGKQPERKQQQQSPNSPESPFLPQDPPPQFQQPARSSQWIPPSTGNPDLDPYTPPRDIDLRQRNPLTPRGMIYDPRGLIGSGSRQDRPDVGLPPGARFDPFGPPDPNEVGPGRGPNPSLQYGVPDPDHFPPPGVPQPKQLGPSNKSLKFPGPPGSGFGPGAGGGGSPFL